MGVHNPAIIISTISEDHKNDVEGSALQELIFQSNPTLEPIVLWPHAPSLRYLPPRSHSEAPAQMESHAYGFISLQQDGKTVDFTSPGQLRRGVDGNLRMDWPE